jgi:hypothetical protein
MNALLKKPGIFKISGFFYTLGKNRKGQKGLEGQKGKKDMN